MKKLLTLIAACVFAAVSATTFAAQHGGAAMKEGEKAEKKADKKAEKKAAKKKAAKKKEAEGEKK